MIFDTNNCFIQIARKTDATGLLCDWSKFNKNFISWEKYKIKESDFRTKTATFSCPTNLDLTTGVYVVRIGTIYHENFAGNILSKEYDEKTGLYTYQCQDFSHNYNATSEGIFLTGKYTTYEILRVFLTIGELATANCNNSKVVKYWKKYLTGLRNIELYNQKLYKGNIINTNPMKNKPKFISRNKSFMDMIRALCSTVGYIDLWFNETGVLQIEPLAREDWLNTGLVLGVSDYMERKFKFDTTNVITGVTIDGSGLNKGSYKGASALINLNLSAFFGYHESSVSTSQSETKTKTKTNATKTTTSSSNNSNMKNPFNNKNKKIMVSADDGSDSFKQGIIKLLKKDDWSVHDIGTWSDAHSDSYRRIDSSYAVNLVIYNGFCAGTVRENYDGWLKGHHEKMGVVLVNMWDTRYWTEGMRPYRYGDFKGYSASRAWDDNFSASNPAISNVLDYMIKYNVRYCCGPTPAEAYKQFQAGGYLKMKGLK